MAKWSPTLDEQHSGRVDSFRRTMGAMAKPRPTGPRFPEGAELVVGDVNGDRARLCIQNYYGDGGRLGDERWVTGAGLDGAIAAGSFTPVVRAQVEVRPGDSMEDVIERLIAAEAEGSG